VVERNFLKHPVYHADVEVHITVKAGADPVDKGGCATVQSSLIRTCRTSTVSLLTLRKTLKNMRSTAPQAANSASQPRTTQREKR